MSTKVTIAPTGKSRFTAAGCAGCMGILMALPFIAFAIFFGSRAMSQMAHGQTSQGMPMAVFAVALGLSVLFTVIVPVFRARRALNELDARKSAAPDQPWLWRADWASRRIVGSYSRQLGRRWVFALFWNAIALPGSYVIAKRALATGNAAQLLVLAFPAFGLWILGAAVRSTLRAARYGRTVLELSTLPGTIGGRLEGTIRVGRIQEPPNSVRMELACVRRLTRSAGRSQSVRETTLWQNGQLIPAVGGETGGLAIPFAFSIPVDAVPTGDQNGSGTVHWRVRAGAEAPGVAYAATFEVPVFRTAASR
jgi:hypothetical protein